MLGLIRNAGHVPDYTPVWRSGSALVLINEVNLRQVRLVLGWVTVSWFNTRGRDFISVCNSHPDRLRLLPSLGR